MIHVTDQHVDQSSSADRRAAGCANSQCGFVAHVVYGEDVCESQIFKLLNQIFQWVIIKARLADVIILLEAG